jgi:hypothetical protein
MTWLCGALMTVREATMGMKASEVGDWLRQIAGKHDHHEVLRDGYLVVRPGPNFDWFMANPAAGQPAPAAPEPDRVGDDRHEDDNGRQLSP